MYTSTSGITSFGPLLAFVVPSAMTVSSSLEVAAAAEPPVDWPSDPQARNKTFAVASFGGKVLDMTVPSIFAESFLRIPDIDRKARSVNLVSNWATPRSRREKLCLMADNGVSFVQCVNSGLNKDYRASE